VDWIKRFVLHFDKQHPSERGARKVEAFLAHLAVQCRVAASTQNQAKAALLFCEVLEQDLPWLATVEQAKFPTRLPVVLTQEGARPTQQTRHKPRTVQELRATRMWRRR